jgi:prepilin-type processing-associated H-X9-DG protein
MLELLVVISLIAVLSTMAFGGAMKLRALSQRTKCTSNLRQLGAAVALYCGDHDGLFPPYQKNNADGSRTWYFGNETTPGGTAEGSRNLDITGGPLYPYIQEVGKIEVCPCFNYASAQWKPKFKGASYGYGYNWLLGGRTTGNPMNMALLSRASNVILFADCSQVNTFQKPASPIKPMLEEFYIINETDRTFHFRHSGKSNVLFVDGHVQAFKPFGVVDTRIKGEIVGRITKSGSTEMLK